jgi:hypothetical protein
VNRYGSAFQSAISCNTFRTSWVVCGSLSRIGLTSTGASAGTYIPATACAILSGRAWSASKLVRTTTVSLSSREK